MLSWQKYNFSASNYIILCLFKEEENPASGITKSLILFSIFRTF